MNNNTRRMVRAGLTVVLMAVCTLFTGCGIVRRAAKFPFWFITAEREDLPESRTPAETADSPHHAPRPTGDAVAHRPTGHVSVGPGHPSRTGTR